MSAVFVILVFGLPLFTFAASLLLNTSGNTMKVFIVVVCFHRTFLLFVTLSPICPHAVFTPGAQYVVAFTIFVKLTLGLPFFTFAASLHLHFSVHFFAF